VSDQSASVAIVVGRGGTTLLIEQNPQRRTNRAGRTDSMTSGFPSEIKRGETVASLLAF